MFKLVWGVPTCSYCGKWVATPALGSAGPTIKIIAYSIAIPGLIAGGRSHYPRRTWTLYELPF